MYNHQTDARGQLDQALAIERALHQAHRRRQSSVWQSRWQSWAPTNRLRLGWLIVALLLTLGIVGAFWHPGTTHAAIPFTAPDPVTAAWEKARAAGRYHFTSDVTQVTIPVATISNVGQSSRTENYYMAGQNDLPSNQLEMTLWSTGGNTLRNQSGVGLKVAHGKTWVRMGDGAWQEREGAADAYAPGGDVMSYLQAITQVRAQAPEERNGIAFTRYTFQIDGPRFAVYARDTLAAALRARGELPPGMNLDASAYYRDMVGEGELWVGKTGLPLRQILTLRFPEQKAQQLHLQMTTDFSKFGTPVMQVADGAPQGHPRGAGGMAAFWMQQTFPVITSILAALGLLLVVIYHGRSRKLYNGLAIAVILSLIIGPLLTTHTNMRFFDTQRAKAATQEEQQAAAQAQQDQRVALGRTEFNPHLSPLESVRPGDQETGRPGDREIGRVRHNLPISQSPHLPPSKPPTTAPTPMATPSAILLRCVSAPVRWSPTPILTVSMTRSR